ncbi:MAG: lytic transglycosylase domain-containing protein [Nitrospirae bacterium]|nr:lytic transglycosylase domain-containing protein [Nitrospirota bacterium]
MNGSRLRQPLRPSGQRASVIGIMAAALLLMASAFPPDARGDIYSFVDQQGTIHFTNVPTDPRFKKVLRDFPSFRHRLHPAELEQAIVRHAQRHNLEPALLRAVIKAESDFDPGAVSRAGAVGLMQLMPHTAMRLAVRDSYDPEENIGGGARHLRDLLDRFQGNLTLALAAYNAGEHVVERYQAVPPFDETRVYVAKVLRFYRAYLPKERTGQNQTLSGRLTAFARPSRSQPVSPWTAPSR